MGARGWGRPYGRQAVETSPCRTDQPSGALFCSEPSEDEDTRTVEDRYESTRDAAIDLEIRTRLFEDIERRNGEK